MNIKSSNFEQFDQSVDALLSSLGTDPAKRSILGVCGCPGSGKSTMAELLCAAVNNRYGSDYSIVVPMDGFHYPNKILDKMGIRHLKGIPDSFKAGAFVDLIRRIKEESNTSISAPVFDRAIESTIENAIEINSVHKLVIVEGNYLLLDTKPWSRLAAYFDQVWFLEVPEAILKERLVTRHEQGGKTKEAALEKVLSTDLPNAELIKETKKRADKVFFYNNH